MDSVLKKEQQKAQQTSKNRQREVTIKHNRSQQAGSFGFLPGTFSGFLLLHELFHETAHSLRSFVLPQPGSVGVGAERESGIVVAQHGGHSLDVYAVLQGHGYEGMPKVVEARNRQSLIKHSKINSIRTKYNFKIQRTVVY